MQRLHKGVFATLCLVSLQAYAGGTSVTGVGARGIAMQAFTAVADDGSAIYYNPAGLAQMNEETVMGGANFVFPNIRYQPLAGPQATTRRSAIGSHLFYVKPVKRKIRIGFGVYAPFARLTRYPLGPATLSTSLSSYFRRVDAVPTVSYAFSDNFSVGLSAVFSHVKVASDVLGFDETADGHGYTGQAGLLWKPSKKLRLGASYRAPETAHTKGTGVLGGIGGSYTSNVRFPGVLNIGLAYQAAQALLLSLEYNNEMWSKVQVAHRSYNNPIIVGSGRATTLINGFNSSNYRAGFAYTVDKANKIYGGYSYSEAAVPVANMAPTLPEFDMNTFAAGFSHKKGRWQFDFSYEYTQLLNQTKSNFPFVGNYNGYNQHVLFNVAYAV